MQFCNKCHDLTTRQILNWKTALKLRFSTKNCTQITQCRSFYSVKAPSFANFVLCWKLIPSEITFATSFSPFSKFYCLTQVASLFWFLISHFLKLLIFECLLSTATKSILEQIVQNKLDKALLHGKRRHIHLVHTFFFSVSFSQQRPELTSLYVFSFLKQSSIFDWSILWQQSDAVQ